MLTQSRDIFNQSWPKLLGLYEEAEAKSLITGLMEDIWSISTPKILLNSSLDGSLVQNFDSYLHKLLDGLPIQHVLGYAWFMDKKYKVSKDVLIPRQETEELVHLILTDNYGFEGTLLDIGTGSGIIPISLKSKWSKAQIYGLDVSKEALTIAQSNAIAHSLEINWMEMDILKKEPDHQFDILVSNPPYVLEKEKVAMHPNVLGKDPDLALFVSDKDPFVFYRRICQLLPKLLRAEGRVYFEINEKYGQEVKALMVSQQLGDVEIHSDLNGKDRIVSGVRNL